jgi:hypothetical protein
MIVLDIIPELVYVLTRNCPTSSAVSNCIKDALFL